MSQDEIFRFLKKQKKATIKEISKALGLSYSTTHSQLKKLLKKRMVKFKFINKLFVYFPYENR